jgi:predicted RND superfamily exporter protein
MDPLTLFALANTAVAAVKKGCQLYKDIKSAAGDVKGVLRDLDDQFHKRYNGKPVPDGAVKQLNEEKARVKDLNKRSEESTNIYTEIGDSLGAYYDNYFKCLAVLEDEEKQSKTEVYSGGDSLAKRALKRVLMKKQLEAMGKELRELMIYQSPPELGALFTEVEAMTKEMGKEQKVLMAREFEKARRKRQRMQKYQFEIALGIASIVLIFVLMVMFIYISYDAQRRWGVVTDTRYRDTLAAVQKQEWFERQRRLKEYEEFLEQRRSEAEQNESSD